MRINIKLKKTEDGPDHSRLTLFFPNYSLESPSFPSSYMKVLNYFLAKLAAKYFVGAAITPGNKISAIEWELKHLCEEIRSDNTEMENQLS